MELKGKVVNFLGDSITEGHGTSAPENRYVNVFGVLTGAKVNNYGIGGTRIAKKTIPSEIEIHDKDFISRVDGMDENADAVVVFGGTNDYGHGDAPMGDMNSRDPYTFYGACHTLMTELIKKYYGKPIVFMTPIQRVNGDSKNSLGHSLAEYVDIIKEVAEYYAIPVIDLYRMSGITSNVPSVMEDLIPDGLHPNDKGARIIAERVKGFMEAL